MNVLELSQLDGYCTGCAACSNICPVNAIDMEMNTEGFDYPKINNASCINCGKCVEVCSIKRTKVESSSNRKVYTYQGNDEIRLKSSSGGLFFALASKVISEGGTVFGAIYDPRQHLIVHSSSNEVCLEQLMRSKYAQSKIGDTYRRVLYELKRNIKVLFCGTPCQVYALKSFLGKEYTNLITVDFVCHGVPSAGVFRDMVKEHIEKEKSNVVDVTFREKDMGWRKQIIKLYFENGKVKKYVSKDYYYYYYYCFLNNIILRNSCYNCTFPKEHCSDLTIMDYWQISGDDDKGVSACVVNTENGAVTLNELNINSFLKIDFGTINHVFTAHTGLIYYIWGGIIRKVFMKAYIKMGLSKTVESYYVPIRFINDTFGKMLVFIGEIKKRLRYYQVNKYEE